MFGLTELMNTTERETERESERDKDRHRYRKTGRQKDIQRDREVERWRERDGRNREGDSHCRALQPRATPVLYRHRRFISLSLSLTRHAQTGDEASNHTGSHKQVT